LTDSQIFSGLNAISNFSGLPVRFDLRDLFGGLRDDLLLASHKPLENSDLRYMRGSPVGFQADTALDMTNYFVKIRETA
jgi:hypothetical protein